MAFIRGWDRTAAALLLAALAGVGTARLALHDRAHALNPLRRLEADGYVDIRGRLVRTPGRDRDRDILVLELASVTLHGVEGRVPGRLRLSVPVSSGPKRRLDLIVGDDITASVRLSPGPGFRNFGGFSDERYLKGLGVHRRASTKSSLLVRVEPSRPRPSIARWVSRARRAAQIELERRFPSPDGRDISPRGAVLEALLLGEDGRLDQETIETLQRTGLFHLFAISGGHIAVLSALLFALFRVLRMTLRASRLALAAAIVLYSLFVEASPTVMRATLMVLAYLVGRLLWKDVHVLNTISLSGFILLVLNPSSLFDIGFQLTFAATLSIVLLAPPLMRRLPRLPLKAEGIAAMSAAATAGVTPVLAVHFNRVTLASFVLNFPAIPLVALIMGLGYLFLPLAALAPSVSGGLAQALEVLVAVFIRLSHALDPVPFLSFRVPTPPPWLIVFYYVLLILALLRPRWKGQRAGLIVAWLAATALLFAGPLRRSSPDLRLTMLDVGQGDSIVVELPGREVMLIDGGGLAGGFDVGERIVSPALWRKGLRRVDYLVLTHDHPDHLDGLIAVARNFRVRELWHAPGQGLDGRAAELDRALGPGVIRRVLARGSRIMIGDVSIDVLHPPQAEGRSAFDGNEGSLVLRISRDEASFLLMGDAGPAAERELLLSGLDLSAAVLKAGHHGSASSTSPALLEAVGPAVVLLSAGRANPFGFPSAAVLDRCGVSGAAVFRTDLDGAVEVRVEGRSLRVRTATGGRGAFDLGLTASTK